MNLSTNGIPARFYKWSYGATDGTLPRSLCPFFWKLILAILLLPVTLPTLPVQLIFPSLRDNDEWSLAGRFFFVCLTAVTLLAIGLIGLTAVNAPLTFFSTVAGVAAVVLFVITGIVIKDSESAEIVVKRVIAYKENYCPPIFWK